MYVMVVDRNPNTNKTLDPGYCGVHKTEKGEGIGTCSDGESKRKTKSYHNSVVL